MALVGDEVPDGDGERPCDGSFCGLGWHSANRSLRNLLKLLCCAW